MNEKNHKAVPGEDINITITRKKLIKPYCKLIENIFDKKDIQKIIDELVIYLNKDK